MRRLITAVVAVAVVATACGSDADKEGASSTAAGTPSSGSVALDGVVISYNSPEEWANWGEVLRAFTAATGVDAPNDPKNSGQTLAALEAEAASPIADTAYYGIVFGDRAKSKGLVEPYRPDGFDAIPEGLKDPDGSWFAVHQGAVAFLVNTDELGDKPVPQSWSDLTDPMYSGLVGFLDPAQSAVGYSVLTAANLALGGTLDDFDPGLEWAAQMVDNGLQLPAQTATAAVQQGEIAILIDADFNGYTLANVDDAPIEVVLPEEGSITIPYVMSLVANGPSPANGKALLDFALSTQGQELFAKSFMRPARTDVAVPDDVAAAMLPEDQYRNRVATPDFAAMAAAQEGVIARWNAEVVG
jgi:putative spermidine/putrescine transport system substrate-binding protein